MQALINAQGLSRGTQGTAAVVDATDDRYPNWAGAFRRQLDVVQSCIPSINWLESVVHRMTLFRSRTEKFKDSLFERMKRKFDTLLRL